MISSHADLWTVGSKRVLTMSFVSGNVNVSPSKVIPFLWSDMVVQGRQIEPEMFPRFREGRMQAGRSKDNARHY